MLTKDLYGYLISNEKLSSLLSASREDSKIYPNTAKIMSLAPFIVYRNNSGIKREEILKEETISFTITSLLFENILDISQTLYGLFEERSNLELENCFLFYSARTACSDYTDDLNRNVRTLSFIFKYKNKQE
ncbi:hypothetical protein Emin_1082 [Elusimicrobium minutum Pei191]|uniref:DUF3168 domain-containing protein n=1 Tax=Elusimicrobium minutum (strain Pei191) TaxID=445932 RepID=B2KDN8_ELUMP|nr:hypothetical protein [Elusimicrobium minutum]ACC98634.1 hypothetical protein Emin_1082 [Elusimicrobium minutum Pei191]